MTSQVQASATTTNDGIDLIDVIRVGAGRKTFMSAEVMRAMGLAVGDRLAFGKLPDGTVVVKKVEF